MWQLIGVAVHVAHRDANDRQRDAAAFRCIGVELADLSGVLIGADRVGPLQWLTVQGKVGAGRS